MKWQKHNIIPHTNTIHITQPTNMGFFSRRYESAPRSRRLGYSGRSRESRRERRAAGYKAALSNPNTTRSGRKHAEHELHAMGRSAHVPLSTKIRRFFGIRKTPRRERERERYDREYHRSSHHRRRRY